MSRIDPTAEQQAIIDAYRPGGNLVIEAGAGTGKTSTLKLLAAADTARRGLYVAYNKAIATDAKASFPGHVKCSTAHSLAYGAVGNQYFMADGSGFSRYLADDGSLLEEAPIDGAA